MTTAVSQSACCVNSKTVSVFVFKKQTKTKKQHQENKSKLKKHHQQFSYTLLFLFFVSHIKEWTGEEPVVTLGTIMCKYN
jgi:cytochrome b561